MRRAPTQCNGGRRTEAKRLDTVGDQTYPDSNMPRCPAATLTSREPARFRKQGYTRVVTDRARSALLCRCRTCCPWLWMPLQMTMSVSLHAFGYLLRRHCQRNRRRVRPHLRKRDERPRMETVRTGRTLLRTNGTRFFASSDSGSTSSIQRSPSTLAPIPCRNRDCWAGDDTNHTSIAGERGRCVP